MLRRYIMTQNTLTKSKLKSYAYNNVFDVINNRSNIPDPKNPNNLDRKFVYKNDPWSKGSDYDGYPYIIVRRPKISYSAVSADGKTKTISFEFSITVRTAMEGAMNKFNDSTGVTNMDDIQDDLEEVFNDETIKQSLRDLNMYSFDLSTDNDDEFIDGLKKHVFESEFTLKCMTRFTVSS